MALIQPDLDMQAFIRKELNENVDTNQRDLEHIKDWLAKQPHLPKFEGEMCREKVQRDSKYRLNFVRLYFLNYTWYVNDLHNI